MIHTTSLEAYYHVKKEGLAADGLLVLPVVGTCIWYIMAITQAVVCSLVITVDNKIYKTMERDLKGSWFMGYQKQKRAVIDRCNICETLTKLTWDHVPPKSCYNNSRVEYNKLFDNIRNDSVIVGGKYNASQNGIKYRSICNKCNNDLLGAKYDKELERMVLFINELITSKLVLPQCVSFDMKINQLARAFVGHILAAKNEYDEESLIDKELRNYFLNSTTLPPKEFKLLFRIYPFNNIVIVRDILVKNVLPRDVEVPDGIISCLSFYPIAFILNDGNSSCGMLDLFSLCTDNIDDTVEMQIDLLSYMYPYINKPRHPLWPCNISDSEDGTCIALITENVNYSVVARKKAR